MKIAPLLPKYQLVNQNLIKQVLHEMPARLRPKYICPNSKELHVEVIGQCLSRTEASNIRHYRLTRLSVEQTS
jgi:hypothetical protein